MRAFTVLDLFEPERQRLTLNEISEGIDLPKSTTFRILQTLVDAGYLVQIDSMHYGLSHRILRLGNCVLPNLGAREIAHPELEKINEATQETVALSEFLGTERILIDVIESTHALKLSLRVGEIVGLDLGATGKLFLTYHPEAREHYKDKPGFSGPAFEKDISGILKKGYAFEIGTRFVGSAGIALPVFDMNNKCRYSIGIYGPDSRLRPNHAKFAELLKSSAQRVSAKLGSTLTLP
tara:strand:- start:2322 stop:3032 length:711 start_codon:yes stop_codon:yes gene_type:complete